MFCDHCVDLVDQPFAGSWLERLYVKSTMRLVVVGHSDRILAEISHQLLRKLLKAFAEITPDGSNIAWEVQNLPAVEVAHVRKDS